MAGIKRTCPVCRSDVESRVVVGLPEAEPASGDICVCLYCGVALEVTEELGLALVDRQRVKEMHWMQVLALRIARKMAVQFRADHDRLS